MSCEKVGEPGVAAKHEPRSRKTSSHESSLPIKKASGEVVELCGEHVEKILYITHSIDVPLVAGSIVFALIAIFDTLSRGIASPFMIVAVLFVSVIAGYRMLDVSSITTPKGMHFHRLANRLLSATPFIYIFVVYFLFEGVSSTSTLQVVIVYQIQPVFLGILTSRNGGEAIVLLGLHALMCLIFSTHVPLGLEYGRMRFVILLLQDVLLIVGATIKGLLIDVVKQFISSQDCATRQIGSLVKKRAETQMKWEKSEKMTEATVKSLAAMSVKADVAERNYKQMSQIADDAVTVASQRVSSQSLSSSEQVEGRVLSRSGSRVNMETLDALYQAEASAGSGVSFRSSSSR